MKAMHILSYLLFAVSLSYGQELYFPPTTDTGWETTALSDIGWCEDKLPAVNEFMTNSMSRALIVLKDGKIVIEEYYNGHSRDSLWYWASAGKSLTAFEIGLLQSDAKLDIGDATSDYLGTGWTSCTTEQELAISIRHQLSMSTGLDYSVANIDCTDPSCLNFLGDPYSEWYYHNAPYTLLSTVIEEASGQSRNLFTFAGLGSTIGLVGAWLPIDDNIVFVSKATAMARFGLLMLAEGNWKDKTILTDTEYFSEMVSPSQEINESYGYLWWLNTGPTYRLPSTTADFVGRLIPDAPEDIYMALGKNGQVLIVDPTSNTVIVRMGDDPDPSPVPTNYITELWDQIQSLACTNSSTTISDTDVTIYPNPTTDLLQVTADYEIVSVEIVSTEGRLMYKDDRNTIDICTWPAGVYIVTVKTVGGQHIERLLKL